MAPLPPNEYSLNSLSLSESQFLELSGNIKDSLEISRNLSRQFGTDGGKDINS